MIAKKEIKQQREFKATQWKEYNNYTSRAYKKTCFEEEKTRKVSHILQQMKFY